MAEIYVTSTADSGAGSLRQAIANAQDGDVILFDTTVFPVGQTTTIYLSSGFSVSKQITINASAARVKLDAQNSSCYFYVYNGSVNIYSVDFANFVKESSYGSVLYLSNGSVNLIDNCTFSNCSITGSGGAIYAISDSESTLNNCTFDTCTATSSGGALYVIQNAKTVLNNCTFVACTASYGGAVYAYGTSANTFDDCTFDACTANAGGAVRSDSNSQNTFDGCTFDACTAANYGGGVSSASTSQNTFTDCTFSTNTANYGGAIYSTNTSQNTLNNCKITNCSATTGGGFYSTGTPTIAIYNSVYTGAPVYIAGQSVATIGESTFDELRITGGVALTILDGITTTAAFTTSTATITFNDGAALTITTSASIGAATFTSAGRGYLAVGAGIDASAATLTNVVLCSYGADVSAFRINIGGAAWSAEDDSIPILLERKNGDSWTTIDASATGGSYSAAFVLGETARAFDGEKFLTATVVFHAWLEYTQTITVATATAKAYDVVAASAKRYKITKGYIMASQYYNRGEAPVFFARIEDSETSTIVPQSAVSSISYTAYKVTTSWSSEKRTPVEGHEDVEVPLAAYLDALVNDDPRWTEDETGYNFIFEPDTTENPIFPDGGKYVVVVTIEFTGANPAPISYEIDVR